MRRAVLSAACLIGLAAFTMPKIMAPALAQEASAEQQPWRFEARAIDMTKMMMSARGSMPAPIPLVETEIDVTFDAPGAGDVTMTARLPSVGALFALFAPVSVVAS